MKKITFLLFLTFCFSLNAQVLTEGFDAGLPAGWTNEYVSATVDWGFGAANQNATVSPRTGAGMATFWSNNYNGDQTRLVTPTMDLSALPSQVLSFYYTQEDWGGDQDELRVYYKTSAAGTWVELAAFTADTDLVWTEVNLVLPNPSADYYIAFDGTSGYGRGITVDDVVIDNAPSCLTPGSLSVFETSATTSDLNWIPAGTETDFTYEYGAVGFTQGTGTSGMVTGNTGAISGLTAGTSYDFYVQANCGVDGDSSFAGPFTWVQADMGESCGTAFAAVIEADCGVATPISLDFTGAPSNISTSCDTFNNYGLWITTTTDASGGLRVNASAAVDMAVFEMCGGADVECFGGGVSPNADMLLSPNTQYYLYFWQEGTGSTAMVDVCLSLPPTCLDPTALTATNITENSADLGWTESGAATAWNVEWGTAGFTQGTGTTVAAPANPHPLTGLTDSTGYEFYVQADCGGGDLSTWVGPFAFTTAFPPPANDDCATAETVSVGAGTCGASVTGNNTGATDSGVAAAGCATATYAGGDLWYTFDVPAGQTEIEYTRSASAFSTAQVELYSGACGALVEVDCTTAATDSFTGLTAGATYYLRIYDWGHDDFGDVTFCLNTPPTCLEPTALAVTNIMDNSADLGWTESGTATAWNVEWGAAGFTQGTGTTVAAPANPHPLAGLTASTAYEFYVQADCGGGDLSTWAGPFSFTTTGPPPANDDCSGAEVIVPSTTGAEVWSTGTTANNTASGELADTDISCTAAFAFGSGRDVWYTVEVPAAGDITIVTQASAGSPLLDTILSVWSGTCGALVGTELGCDDDGGTGNFSEVALTGQTPGAILYIRVQEYGASASRGPDDGAFEISAHATDPSLSTTDFDSNTGFTYYPNPVNDNLTLKAQKDIQNVTVYNMLGQEVLNATPNAVNSDVDMSNLQSGAYFVKVTIENVTETIRIIKN